MKICVYGASGDKLDPRYFEAARDLGRCLGRHGHGLVFGGGQGGLMGACALGAEETGAEILGVAPRFFDEPGILFPRCTRFLFTETMAQRKQLMEDESDAFVILPGGIGTLEEFFETLTLKQLGRHGKPMAVLNTLGYYDAMLHMLESAADGGFMSRNCLKLFAFCALPEEAVQAVETAEVLTGSIQRLSDYSK
ncbi:MAG: TIGR00730 family Rossman fold protein [Oscillospiraceae bacterium]|nr:TIGR00730 family Rossman fold protein [Oscillospiraceae bacterium]